MVSTVTLEEIYEDFEDLPDWEARCDYLIDLGFELPEFPSAHKTEANRVHGCQSMVWLTAELDQDHNPPVLEIQADSDAMIVKGLIAVILAIYSGRPLEDVVNTDVEEIFAKLGLTRHLSPARRNGLFGMVKRIRQLAIEKMSQT
ncbi:MAG: SufE family protein [Planctomycetaceae bacterium]|nr:SufE family protein [Planctomycetaceae bacterium]